VSRRKKMDSTKADFIKLKTIGIFMDVLVADIIAGQMKDSPNVEAIKFTHKCIREALAVFYDEHLAFSNEISGD
jgi:hypothetical protein